MTGERASITAILLAAGSGSRFGGKKLLAEYEGRPLISAVLETLSRSPVDETLVVVGDDAEELRPVLDGYAVRMVENPRWAEGQSTSVLAGLEACGPEVGAAVVLLADQPLVGAEAVERLVRAYSEGADVAVATYDGEPRNPVVFARGTWPVLLEELEGDRGAREVLRRRPEWVTLVACDGVGDPSDVDTAEDLRRLRARRER